MEHLDVLIVGAGLSGIGAAHYIQTECPWAELRDLRGARRHRRHLGPVPLPGHPLGLGHVHPRLLVPAVGGRQDHRRRRRRSCSTSGTPPPRTASTQKIRFHHRVVGADWSTDEARWHVTAERTDTGETVELTAGFVFSCTGYYRYDHGYQPDFAGIDDFTGTVVHPQFWPDDLDFAGKRVVVIGSGATAITLVPSLAETAAHVTMLQRSPTYIASVPEASTRSRPLAAQAAARGSGRGPLTRWAMALGTQGSYQLSGADPALVKKLLLKGVERSSCPRATTSTPTSRPATTRGTSGCAWCPTATCSRPSARAGVGVVTDTIDTFTEHGIRGSSPATSSRPTSSSRATGLELLFLGGIELTVDGEPVDLAEQARLQGDDARGRAEPGRWRSATRTPRGR